MNIWLNNVGYCRKLVAMTEIQRNCIRIDKELYDRKRHGKPLKVGNQVMLHSTVIPQGHSRKFLCPWTSPYKIIKKMSDINYRIQRYHCRKQLVVHFNRLKLCPLNMRDNSRRSQDSKLLDSHFAELTLSRQVPCEQLAYVPDDESTSKLIPETLPNVEEASPNVEETVVTFLSGSSDVAFTQEEIGRGTSKSQCEARTSGLDPSSDGLTSRRYPSRSHRPPTRFDDYV